MTVWASVTGTTCFVFPLWFTRSSVCRVGVWIFISSVLWRCPPTDGLEISVPSCARLLETICAAAWIRTWTWIRWSCDHHKLLVSVSRSKMRQTHTLLSEDSTFFRPRACSTFSQLDSICACVTQLGPPAVVVWSLSANWLLKRGSRAYATTLRIRNIHPHLQRPLMCKVHFAAVVQQFQVSLVCRWTRLSLCDVKEGTDTSLRLVTASPAHLRRLASRHPLVSFRRSSRELIWSGSVAGCEQKAKSDVF